LAELLELAACPFRDPLKICHELSVERIVGRSEGLESPLAGREEDQEDVPLLNVRDDGTLLAGQQPSQTSSTFRHTS
jgi:hypothetical protein